MFLVHNERSKLTAAWLNALATALVAAGTFAPFAAVLYGFSTSSADPTLLVVLAGICFVAGIGLHCAERVYLGRLRE